MFSLNEILKATGGKILYAGCTTNKRVRAKGISIDSRTIKKGELFIAIRGRCFDGHNFVYEAIRKGAWGVIIESVPEEAMPALKDKGRIGIQVSDTLRALGDIAGYHRRRFNIPIIGITGSNGKTTVKDMISWCLEKGYNVLKNPQTENNLIGLPLALLRLTQRHTVAVIEMGANHIGEIRRLAEILKPSIGLITNIGASHLEFLKNKKGVLSLKTELVDILKRKDILVLNGDDPLLDTVKYKCKRLRFGLKKDNDFFATKIRINRSISFLLNDRYPFLMNLLGLHNIYNALASITISLHLGIDISALRDALFNFRLPPRRMELRSIDGVDIIDDTYNSNPLSLKWAIKTFSDLKSEGRKILVMGDMLELGRMSRYFHTLVGRVIAYSSIDKLITVGKFSTYTAMAAKRAGMKQQNLWVCNTTKEALKILIDLAKRKDKVLVKGSRGIAMERIVEGFKVKRDR